jgi:MATE family multidrug resistance protein
MFQIDMTGTLAARKVTCQSVHDRFAPFCHPNPVKDPMDAGLEVTNPGPRITGHSVSAWAAEARELLRLAVPMAATQLAQMIILATDTVMLGHYNKESLAAGAIGNTVFFFIWLLGTGPVSAVAPMIAHVVGRHSRSMKPRERREIRLVVRMGLWSVALMTPPLLTALFFTRDILLLARQEPQLAADAGIYTTALAFGLPCSLAFQVLRNFSTSLSRPVPPMVVMGLAILFNALGDYVLIFGHFGFPRLGLVGAGFASASSNLFTLIAMAIIALVLPELRAYRFLRRFGKPHWASLRELFHLGLPIGITMLFEVALFNAATLAMGTFGIAMLAAHQIAITIPSLTFMVPLGIGLAATVRVGLAAGAGDIYGARRAGFTAMGLGAIFMLCAALVLLVFPHSIAALWLPDSSANRDVLTLAVTFLHVAAGFQLMDGLQVTASMSLRGLKDARGPMWLAGASYWLAGAPMCALLGFGFKMQGLGIWLGLAFGLLVAAVLLTTRFAILSRGRTA